VYAAHLKIVTGIIADMHNPAVGILLMLIH
jgi:hypothetical protein